MYGTWDSVTSTCTLNQDLNESVEITANDTTLDCNGHGIINITGYYSVYLTSKKGIVLRNCNINNSGTVYLLNSNNNTILNNSLSFLGPNVCIFLGGSNNTASNNDITSCRTGILVGGSGNTVSNNNLDLKRRGEGIEVGGSGNTLVNNTIKNSSYEGSIYLAFSSYNTLRNNRMSASTINLNILGSDLSHYLHDIDTSNTVDGKPVYYLVNEQDRVIDASTNASYVGVVNSSNITIKDLILENNCQGVLFVNTNHSRIENVNASGRDGIYLFKSSDNTLLNNNASPNIFIKDSPHNTLRNNTMMPWRGSFHISGSDLSHFLQDIDTSNKIAEEYIWTGELRYYPIYYLVNEHDRVIPTNAGFVAAVNSTNIIVEDLTLEYNSHGVLFVNTNNSQVENVNAEHNIYGVYLLNSFNNTILRNDFGSSSTTGSDRESIFLFNSSDNRLEKNEVSSKAFTFIALNNSHNNMVYDNIIKETLIGNYGIYLEHSNNNTISDNSLRVTIVNYGAMYISYSNNTIISNNRLFPEADGLGYNNHIILRYSSDNKILNNDISFNNGGGIGITSGSSNIISNNTINNNPQGGITISQSSYNTISNNDVSLNSYGINTNSLSYSTISSNNIFNNSGSGIRLSNCNYNEISNNSVILNNYGIETRYDGISNLIYNNFFDNQYNFMISTQTNNYWNITKTPGKNIVYGNYLGGNYWSDYAGIDDDDDGLGDTAYVLNNNNIDYLPLILQVNCSDAIKNQDETDIDCGGNCPACEDGKSCLINFDCISGYCNPDKICSTPNAWAITYGGSNNDNGNFIQQTSDGGFIVAGSTESFGAGDDDSWILKLSSTGDVEWQQTYGGINTDNAYSIQQTTDGGYIVAGYTNSFGAGDDDSWILKLSSTGDVEWQQTYGGINTDNAYSIQQTTDGGYIVAGYTNSFGAGNYDFWILKLTSTGAIEWQRTYGGDSYDRAYSIQQTSDNGYIVAGKTYSFGDEDYPDIWILKLSSIGDIEWQQTYGGSDPDHASSIKQTSDGGYIVGGITARRSGWAWKKYFWVLKLTPEGGIEWEHTFIGQAPWNSAGDLSVLQTDGGEYIVAGWTDSFGVDDDFWVLKLSENGDVGWQKTYGGDNNDRAYSVQETIDNGYIVAGYTGSFDAGEGDMWVLKLFNNGDIDQACDFIESTDATVGGTYITPGDTNIMPNNTNVIPLDTDIFPQNTDAIVNPSCYTSQMCSDGIKNGYETDVDCGGYFCLKCVVGKICLVDSDCESNYCKNNICTEPPNPVLWNITGVFIAGRIETGTGPEPPLIFADGTGGGVIDWGYDKNQIGLVKVDYYMQRVDSKGITKWRENGTLISSDVNSKATPLMVSDGGSGMIITWTDYKSGRKIFANRVNIDGQFLWEDDVVVMSIGREHNGIVSDQQGGAIVMGNTGTSTNPLKIQRIDGNGNVKWATGGIYIVDPTILTSSYWPYLMIGDNNSGAFVAWADTRGDGTLDGIYIQHINTNGEFQWIDNGVPIKTTTNTSFYFQSAGIANDGVGGAIIAWLEGDSSSDPFRLYVQHVNADGTLTWENDGILIGTDVSEAKIVSNAEGGAIIVWRIDPFTSGEIYAQKINSNGIIQWSNNTLISANGYRVSTVPDNLGGAIIAWTISGYPNSIYSQKLNTEGRPRWGNNGIMISEHGGGVYDTTSDGFDGALLAWVDNYSVYAQKINDVIPTCSDGIKNYDETDIDCGGSCYDCDDGKQCLVNSDCLSGFCNPDKLCSTPITNLDVIINSHYDPNETADVMIKLSAGNNQVQGLNEIEYKFDSEPWIQKNINESSPGNYKFSAQFPREVGEHELTVKANIDGNIVGEIKGFFTNYKSNKTPVILVHDYTSDPGSLSLLKERLENADFEVYVSDFSPLEGNCDSMSDIKWYAKVLKIEIRDILRDTGADKVDIVGYGMGGLVARWYVEKLNGSSNVRKLILLGTPNHGSAVWNPPPGLPAWTFLIKQLIKNIYGTAKHCSKKLPFFTFYVPSLGEAAKQMDPFSEFIRTLNDDFCNRILTTNVHYATIAGRKWTTLGIIITEGYFLVVENDGMVSVESVELCNNDQNHFVEYVDHKELIEDEAVYNRINWILDDDPPDVNLRNTSMNLQIQRLPLISGVIENEIHSYNESLSFINKTTLFLAWDYGDLNLSLITPDNETITSTTLIDGMNITYSTGDNFETFEILNPLEGNWTINVIPINTSNTNYSIISILDTNLTLFIMLDKFNYYLNEDINLTANLTYGTPLDTTSVEMSIARPDEIVENISLVYSDGIYSANYNKTNLTGLYYLTVTANGMIDDKEFSRQTSARIWVSQPPDLTVNEISFSNNTPVIGDNVTVSSVIENIADGNATNATVEFYLGNNVDGTLIEVKKRDVMPHSSENVSINWTAEYGLHDIYVSIPASNPFLEENYSNNIGFNTINVTGPVIDLSSMMPVEVNLNDLFEVGLLVENEGTELINGEAEIILASGLSTLDPLTVSLGNVSDNKTVSWNLDADQEGLHEVTVKVTSENSDDIIISKNISVINIEVTSLPINLSYLKGENLGIDVNITNFNTEVGYVGLYLNTSIVDPSNNSYNVITNISLLGAGETETVSVILDDIKECGLYNVSVSLLSHSALLDTNKTNFTVYGCLTYNISLLEGWNLISIPLELDNNTLAYALSSIEGNYGNVFSYNSWRELNDNSIINNTVGLWIKMLTEDNLTVNGTLQDNVLFDLKQGYNLIGYPSLNESNATYIFENVNNDLTNVFAYDGGWKSFNPVKSTNTLETLKPGLGYWVDVNDNVSWSFDGRFG